MQVKIPENNRKFSQPNNGDLSGNIYSTFNIDLVTSPGKIKVSPSTLMATSSADNSNLGLPGAFAYFRANIGGNDASRYWALCDTAVFQTINPSGSWAEDTEAGNPTTSFDDSDMKTWDGVLVVSTASKIVYRDNTSWNDLVASGVSGPIILEVGANKRLYFTDSGRYVRYHTASSGGSTGARNAAGTIDLGQEYEITWLRRSATRMWVGTMAKRKGEGVVAEWDMSDNATEPNAIYHIGATGSWACAVVNDNPYVLTSDGLLKQWGKGPSGFSEVGRLPSYITKYMLDSATLTSQSGRPVHRNGMQVVDGKIRISINAKLDTNDDNSLENMASGVWEFDPQNPDLGIYHRYSPTLANDGSVDYGQSVIDGAGAIFEVKGDSCSMLSGFSVYTDNESTVKHAIFYDDIGGTTHKRGIITAPWIYSEGTRENWSKIITTFKKFDNDTDAIRLKYRQSKKNHLPFIASIAWIDDETITSDDTNFQYASVGDEVEVIVGSGAGTAAHIESIEGPDGNGSYIIALDEAVPVISAGNQSKARINNWKKIKTISSPPESVDEKDIPSTSATPAIQLRAELRGTGDNPEIDQFILISNQSS